MEEQEARLARSCCFTGHRSSKLPWGGNEADARCLELKRKLADALEELYGQGVRHFICGMATGCDMFFAEAVLAYSPDKGAFLPFARTVLSRRLIDYGRREARWHRGHVSLEEEAGQAAVNAASVQAHEMKMEQEARREEIARLSAALAKHSIGFSDLASAAPKQEGTR